MLEVVVVGRGLELAHPALLRLCLVDRLGGAALNSRGDPCTLKCYKMSQSEGEINDRLKAHTCRSSARFVLNRALRRTLLLLLLYLTDSHTLLCFRINVFD